MGLTTNVSTLLQSNLLMITDGQQLPTNSARWSSCDRHRSFPPYFLFQPTLPFSFSFPPSLPPLYLLLPPSPSPPSPLPLLLFFFFLLFLLPPLPLLVFFSFLFFFSSSSPFFSFFPPPISMKRYCLLCLLNSPSHLVLDQEAVKEQCLFRRTLQALLKSLAPINNKYLNL